MPGCNCKYTSISGAMSRDTDSPAVVLLSGGLDSATVLAIAINQGYRCHALSFDYGQKHKRELDCARKQAARAASHTVITLPPEIFSTSALTSGSLAIPAAGSASGIPPTYVPARNTVFLSLALAMAENTACCDIFIGANTIDYPGYPDCRPEFIEAFARMANLATRVAEDGMKIKINAPLLQLGKEEIIKTGIRLGVDYGDTISCYQPDGQGRACGKCDSCHFRMAGFAALGRDDPAAYT